MPNKFINSLSSYKEMVGQTGIFSLDSVTSLGVGEKQKKFKKKKKKVRISILVFGVI